jgi:hypothetical protein
MDISEIKKERVNADFNTPMGGIMEIYHYRISTELEI